MRKVHAFLLAVSTATFGFAQSPLTTLFASNNSGNPGGGNYFNLTVNTTVTISQFDLNTVTAANTAGTFEIWLGPTTWVGTVTNPSLWTLVATAPVTTAPNNTPTVAALATPFALGPGQYGVALHAVGFQWAYTNGTGSNQTYSTTEMTLNAGGASNFFLDPVQPVFSPRVWNGSIHYTLGGNPIRVASQEKYGQGCYGFWTSFYEVHGNPTGWDLGTVAAGGSGVSVLKFTFGGPTYAVSDGTATSAYTAPAGAPVTLASGSSNFMASSVLPGNTLPFPILYPRANGVGIASDLEISTEGYITPTTNLGGGPETNPVDSTPTFGEFLLGSPRWAPLWKNLDPATLGNMTVELEGATGALVVSWNGVADPVGATTTSTFQVAFFANGNVEYRYASMSQNGGGTYPIVCGWSQGGGALDRGSIDISASLPFSTDPIDNTPLDLVMTARPVLGTNPNFTVTGYSGTTVLGAKILSFTQLNPGISLAPLGMPGCFQYLTTDDISVFFTTGPSTNVAFIPGGIPNLPSFNGLLVFSQAATFTSGFNPLGVITSNGLRLLLGSL